MSSEETVTETGLVRKRRHDHLVQEEHVTEGGVGGSKDAEEGNDDGSAAKRIRLNEDEAADSTTISTVSSTPVDSADVPAPSPTVTLNTSGPSRKRVRLESGSDRALEEPSRVPTSPLLTIPPEIFSEIVLSTASPADALSLSLTCKAFLSSLSLPQSSFIWTALRRDVGKNYDWEVAQLNGGGNPNLSDEEKEKRLSDMYGMPDWERLETEGGGWKGMLFKSEQEFLGFSYGIGVGAGDRLCETCEEEVPYGKSYASYALRISLCDKRECKKSFIATHLTKARYTLRGELEGHQLHDELRAHLETYVEGEFRGVPKEAAPIRTLTSFQGAHYVYRKDVSELEQIVDSALGMTKDQRDEMLGREKTRMAAWTKLCDDLALWRRRTRDYYYKNRKANERSCHALALKHEWNPEDLLNCTVYGPYHRNKNHTMGRVSDVDIDMLMPTVLSQMAALVAKRTRGARDAVYHTFRDQINAYHKHLVKLSPSYNPYATNNKERDVYPIVPALSAFRDLEVMRMLQTTHIELPTANFVPNQPHSLARGRKANNEGKSWRENIKDIVKQGDVGRSLRGDKVLGVIVKDQVGRWVQSAKEGLAKVLAGSTLGVSNVIETGDDPNISAEGPAEVGAAGSSSDGKVPPTPGKLTLTEAEEVGIDPEHFTARFRCKKCQVYDSDYAEDECLDFKGACMHECTINGVKGNRKAIAILQKVEALGKEKYPDSKDSVDLFLGIGVGVRYQKNRRDAQVWRTDVVCMSCEVPLLMKVKDTIGHSHRHDAMQIKPVWSGVTVEAPDDVKEVLKTYREYPLVKQGTTKEMLSKRWSSKPAKPKPKEEFQGPDASKKKKAKGRGRKGKGNASVSLKESTKGKGKAQDVNMETEQAKRDPVSGSMEDTEKKDEERRFACRHCHNVRVLSGIRAAATERAATRDPDSSTGIAEAAEASGSGAWGGGDSMSKQWGDRSVSAPSSKPLAWMEWNGMRSHLKAKHGVVSIRDEDYLVKGDSRPSGYSGGYMNYGLQIHGHFGTCAKFNLPSSTQLG